MASSKEENGGNKPSQLQQLEGTPLGSAEVSDSIPPTDKTTASNVGAAAASNVAAAAANVGAAAAGANTVISNRDLNLKLNILKTAAAKSIFNKLSKERIFAKRTKLPGADAITTIVSENDFEQGKILFKSIIIDKDFRNFIDNIVDGIEINIYDFENLSRQTFTENPGYVDRISYLTQLSKIRNSIIVKKDDTIVPPINCIYNSSLNTLVISINVNFDVNINSILYKKTSGEQRIPTLPKNINHNNFSYLLGHSEVDDHIIMFIILYLDSILKKKLKINLVSTDNFDWVEYSIINDIIRSCIKSISNTNGIS